MPELVFILDRSGSMGGLESDTIGADRAVRYECDSAGAALNFEAISGAVSCVRDCVPLTGSWKERIEKDFRKRGKRH